MTFIDIGGKGMGFWDRIITFVVVLFIIYCITKDVDKQTAAKTDGE